MLTQPELDARIATLLPPLPPQIPDPWQPAGSPPLQFTYQFAGAAQPGDLGAQFTGWTEMTEPEKAAFRSAIAALEAVTNIDFVEVTGAADPDFNYGKVNIGANTGIGGNSISWSTFNGVTTKTWDGFTVIGNGTDLSGAGAQHLLLHELGHSLGLKHPGNYDIFGQLPPPPFLSAAEDNNLYSLMSYNGIPGSGIFSNSLMVYDIAALQKRWGANTSYRTGNDTYFGGVGGQITCIWDAGGTDIIDGTAHAGGVTVSLRNGEFSSLGAANNLIIAYGAVIENARGSNGADTMTGNAYNNTLIGNGGIDILRGGFGADRIDGGDGNDSELHGQGGVDIVTGGLGDDRIFGGTENDTLGGGAGRDTVYGGDGADTITGGDEVGAGDLGLSGEAGSDTVYGGQGNDRIDGGADNDRLLSGEAGSDTITGGLGDDRIDGGTENDNLQGQDGNDVITGGAGGDSMSGGAGIDRLDGGLDNDTLDGGTANDNLTGGAGFDRFNFELANGSDTVFDFVNDVDTLTIDPGFGFASAAAVAAATIQSGDYARIILGGGNQIYLTGFLAAGSGNTISSLLDDILIA